MKRGSELGLFTRLSAAVAFMAFIVLMAIPMAEARRGAQPPVQPGKVNCRLADGKVDMPGYPVVGPSGTQVATKRVVILWRYVDANCDGAMTWGVGPAEGADYLRIVPRTIYDFTSAGKPVAANNQVQLSTHHFGPFDPAIPLSGAFRETAFREVHHDDLIQGLPAPGDFVVTQGPDGPAVPGLTISVHLFTDSGDATFIPGVVPKWGARYVLTIDPALSDGTIPAGAYMFMDSQLNVYNVVPGANGACEFGFSEEDWINVNGGGPVQPGPNTAATSDPNVVPVPIRFAPHCSNNVP